MSDQVTLRLGKQDPVYNPQARAFTSFRVSKAPVTVPTLFGHGNTFKEWGFLGNDKWGDCVWAGFDHEEMLIENLSHGDIAGQEVVKFTTYNALSDYSACTGFQYTEATDQGTNVEQALEYRLKTGVIDATGKRHKIVAWVALEPGNLEHLKEAMWLFSAVGIGFQCPYSALEQYRRGEVWSVVPGASVDGGHYVPLVGVPATGNLTCITWGRRQVMTNGFYKKYCDEAYAYITLEDLNEKTKLSLHGFDWAALQEDLKLVA